MKPANKAQMQSLAANFIVDEFSNELQFLKPLFLWQHLGLDTTYLH